MNISIIINPFLARIYPKGWFIPRHLDSTEVELTNGSGLRFQLPASNYQSIVTNYELKRLRTKF
jgi:hypothetical protein